MIKQFRRVLRALVVMLCLSTAGCALLFPGRYSRSEVYGTWRLDLPSQCIDSVVREPWPQALAGHYEFEASNSTRKYSFEAEVEVQTDSDTAKIVFVGFTPFGNRGLLVRSANGKLEEETNPLFEFPVSGMDLLNLLSLAVVHKGPLDEHCNAVKTVSERTTSDSSISWALRSSRNPGRVICRVTNPSTDKLKIVCGTPYGELRISR